MMYSVSGVRERFSKKGSSAAREISGLVRRLSRRDHKTMSHAANRSPTSEGEPYGKPALSYPDYSLIDLTPSFPSAENLVQYQSSISHATILESTALAKEYLEAACCPYASVDMAVKLRETVGESSYAILDTGAAFSFISAYEAHTKFDPSEIKQIPVPVELHSMGGPLFMFEYVVADIFIPCKLDGQDMLAKTSAVLFISPTGFAAGADILLGADYLNQQGISILFPKMQAILGCCGNAEVALKNDIHSSFPLRAQQPYHKRQPTQSHNTKPHVLMVGPSKDSNDETGWRPSRKNDIKQGGVFGGVRFWNSRKLIPFRKAQRRGQISKLEGKATSQGSRDQPATINNHPNPLRSNPGPGLLAATQDLPIIVITPPDTLGYNPGPDLIATSAASPSHKRSEDPKSPVRAEPDMKTGGSSKSVPSSPTRISAPSVTPNRFTVSDDKVFQSPRSAPKPPTESTTKSLSPKSGAGVPRKSLLRYKRFRSPSKGLSRSASRANDGERSEGAQGKSENATSAAQPPTLPTVIKAGQVEDNTPLTTNPEDQPHRARLPKDRSELKEAALDPNAEIDISMSAKVGCEEDVAKTKF